jgi:hypothetical protein
LTRIDNGFHWLEFHEVPPDDQEEDEELDDSEIEFMDQYARASIEVHSLHLVMSFRFLFDQIQRLGFLYNFQTSGPLWAELDGMEKRLTRLDSQRSQFAMEQITEELLDEVRQTLERWSENAK